MSELLPEINLPEKKLANPHYTKSFRADLYLLGEESTQECAHTYYIIQEAINQGDLLSAKIFLKNKVCQYPNSELLKLGAQYLNFHLKKEIQKSQAENSEPREEKPKESALSHDFTHLYQKVIRFKNESYPISLTEISSLIKEIHRKPNNSEIAISIWDSLLQISQRFIKDNPNTQSNILKLLTKTPADLKDHPFWQFSLHNFRQKDLSFSDILAEFNQIEFRDFYPSAWNKFLHDNLHLCQSKSELLLVQQIIGKYENKPLPSTFYHKIIDQNTWTHSEISQFFLNFQTVKQIPRFIQEFLCQKLSELKFNKHELKNIIQGLSNLEHIQPDLVEKLISAMWHKTNFEIDLLIQGLQLLTPHRNSHPLINNFAYYYYGVINNCKNINLSAPELKDCILLCHLWEFPIPFQINESSREQKIQREKTRLSPVLQKIYNEIRNQFTNTEIFINYNFKGIKIPIFFPQLNLGIENEFIESEFQKVQEDYLSESGIDIIKVQSAQIRRELNKIYQKILNPLETGTN